MTCKDFKPSEADIQWTRNLLASLKDEGLWVYPGIGAVFKKTGPMELTLVHYTQTLRTMPNFGHNLKRLEKVAKAAGVKLRTKGTAESAVFVAVP